MPDIYGQSLRSSSSTQIHALGELRVYGGRKFRYAKAGELLVAGTGLQSPVVQANHQACAVAVAAAIGATEISITLGATATTVNQYANGWLNVNSTPGHGLIYEIKSHPAHAGSGTLVVTLKEGITVALTTGSIVDLVLNPWNGVIIAPATTLTGTVVGCAYHPIASGEYGWIGTGGPFSTLVDATPIVGSAVGLPGDHAGELIASSAILTPCGVMMAVGVDGLNKPVYWYLD